MSRKYDMTIINIRLALTILFILEKTFPFDVKCPELSQRKYRANKFCASNSLFKYACLLDINTDQMNESCSIKPDFAPLGEKYIISGSRTTTPCSFERFQPFKLYANISYQCLLRKSICSEEGQTISLDQSTITDRKCRCDFNKGYDYIYDPEDPCSCIPSEEDCSCYMSGEIPRYKCKATDHGSTNPSNGIIVTPVNISDDNSTHFQAVKRFTLITVIAIPVLCILYTVIFIVVNVYMRHRIKDTFSKSGIKKHKETSEEAKIKKDTCSQSSKDTTDHQNRFGSDSDVACLSQNVELIAAIDIGTTSSVYSYCIVSDTQKSKISSDIVELNIHWDALKGGLWSPKTPTCVLLSKDHEVISIGYDAQCQYRNYIYGQESKDYDMDESLQGCFFVDKFKMRLYDTDFFKVKEQMINDVKDRPVPAIKAFSSMIYKLKEQLQEELTHIPPESIHWILTIPACWTQEAKDFMRQCAKEAGINKKRLSIVVESEAASVYVYQLMLDGKLGPSIKKMPNKYLVVDIGGGTSDITAHGVESGKLTKLCKPSGSDNGGTKVDQFMVNHFRAVVGTSVHNALQNNMSYFELLDEFETLNNNVSMANVKRVACKVPQSILSAIYNAAGESFSDILEKSSTGRSKGILLTNDRLRFEKSIINSYIKKVAVGIVADIEHVLIDFKSNEIQTFIVVGGFSYSPVIRKELSKSFPDKTIIFLPRDAELAVVRGAVLYGLNPNIIKYLDLTSC